jgi:hypothetical protein
LHLWQVEAIAPGLIEELDTGYKAVKYSVLNLKLFKAFQEAVMELRALEARVATLEANC